jgi:CRP/FNR family cyclic AMP-dependent transcriptional regulator
VHFGQRALSLFVVLEGSVQLYLDDDAGRVVELQQLGPGECFGAMSLGDLSHTGSFRTLNACSLCVVPRAEFEDLMRTREDLSAFLTLSLIDRIRTLTEVVRGLALMDVYGRIARLLEEQAALVATGRRRVISLSQLAISKKVGASPAMVNRILRELAAGGFLTASRGQIELLKPIPARR